MNEDKLIEMVYSFCAEKSQYSGVFNLDLSICYFSTDHYLEYFEKEVFQDSRLSKKPEELIQVKKNDLFIEIFIACSVFQKNLRIEISSGKKSVLFFGEITPFPLSSTQIMIDDQREIIERAKKEIQDYFLTSDSQKVRKSQFN